MCVCVRQREAGRERRERERSTGQCVHMHTYMEVTGHQCYTWTSVIFYSRSPFVVSLCLGLQTSATGSDPLAWDASKPFTDGAIVPNPGAKNSFMHFSCWGRKIGKEGKLQRLMYERLAAFGLPQLRSTKGACSEETCIIQLERGRYCINDPQKITADHTSAVSPFWSSWSQATGEAGRAVVLLQ